MKRMKYLLLAFVLFFTVFFAKKSENTIETYSFPADYNYDIISNNDLGVEKVNIEFDYTNKDEFNSRMGMYNSTYTFNNAEDTKIFIPFVVSIEEFDKRNIELYIDGEKKDYKAYFISNVDEIIKNNVNIQNLKYEEIEKNIKGFNNSDETYHEYIFPKNVENVFIKKEIIEQNTLIVSGCEIIRNNTSIDNSKYVALQKKENKEIKVYSKGIDIKDYFGDYEYKYEYNIFSELEFNTHFVPNPTIEKGAYFQQYIDELFEKPGIYESEIENICKNVTLALVSLSIPTSSRDRELSVSYNLVAAVDQKYKNYVYETDLKINESLYQNVNSFRVEFKLPSDSSNVTFSLLDLNKNGSTYIYDSDKMPIEIKAFFCHDEVPVLSINSIGATIYNVLKMIIIPLIILIMLVLLVIDFISLKEKYINEGKNIKDLIKDFYIKVKESIPELLVFLVILYKFLMLYIDSSYYDIFNICGVLCILSLTALYVYNNTLNLINFNKLILYSILAVISMFIRFDFAFVILIAVSLCFLKKGPKAFLKSFIISIFVMFIFTLLLNLYGIIYDEVFIGRDGFIRESFGFSHPNTVMLFVFVLITSFAYYKKFNMITRIITFTFALLMFFATDSRTGFLCVIILFILEFIARFIRYNNKVFSFVIVLFPLFTLISIGIGFLLHNSQLNGLLSGRPYIFYILMTEYDWISLFGLDLTGKALMPLDNLFLNVLIYQGVISYFIYLFFYTIVGYKLYKTKNVRLIFIYVVYLIFSLFEATLMSFSCAFLLPLMFISEFGEDYNIDGTRINRKVNEKKRVLHIPNYYYPHIGGIEQTTADIVNALKNDDNIEQVVICFNTEKKTQIDYIDGIKIIRVGVIAKVASQSISIFYRRELSKIIKEFNPDIIHFHYPNPLVSTMLLSLRFKSELIIHWHLDITKQKLLKILFRGQNKRLIKRAIKVIATSPNYVEKSKYLQMAKEKLEIIPSMINTNRLSENEESNNIYSKIKEKYNGKKIIFAVGRHVKYKGMEYLIRASKLLDSSYKVLIGGSGPLTDSLKELAKDDEKVEFLGRISDNEMIAYYKSCDIFAFPSITKNEAFGLSLAEGMYFGKPAVTFTIEGSGVNYVNLDKVTGIEVENCNYEKFAEALKYLSNNVEVALEYGKNAHNRVINNFVDIQFNEKIINLYSKIANEKSYNTIYINGKYLSQKITGVQRFARQIVDEFEKNDYYKYNKFVVVCPKDAVIPEGYKRVKYVKLPFKGYVFEQYELPSYVIDNGAKVLLNLCNLAPVLYPGSTVIHDMNLIDNKDFYSFSYRTIVKTINHLNIKKYNPIFTVSDFSNNRLKDYYKLDDSKVKTIYSGVEGIKVVDYTFDKFEFANKEFFLTVGSFNKTKNFNFVIEAAKNNPSKTFVVTGGVAKAFQDVDVERPENVIFTGYIDDNELNYLYSKCSAFIFPSFYEGFGVPPLEAVSYGCRRIILSDIKVFREIYKDYASYVDPYDPKTIDQLLDNSKVLTEEEAKQLIESYSWERTTRLLYDEIKVKL